ncbi:MAG: alanine--tRNA ligase, partial [Desulfatibacillaceae bacterium]|nr:alanine--tRNA ligase [Desulfatibacillaceae bacterium]
MAKTGNEIRREFLNFFQNNSHRIVESSSLVPHDDPTLLFTNAGMVQFKRIFLGEEKRDYSRAATSQKCVRAGGKHNDLENVGHTARHHTFFEMLGNFSFGDYFKELAIELSWSLLVDGFSLPKERLWVSVFQDDDEAEQIWRQRIGVPADRVVRLGEKDNFWSMGDTGPCGPCSEIHIDRGEKFGCGSPNCAVGCECDRFLEIWNLVFMQYNRDASGKMTPLPRPSIDTGMGLERIASVVQNAPTNYETDLFLPIIRTLEQACEKKLGASKADDISMKVIADHSRAAAFLIGDGVMPSNEGRGYVLRRIMRRAIRYGRNLGLTKPFLHSTAKTVCNIMEQAYPELSGNLPFIETVIVNEENRFRETLDKGLEVLENSLGELAAKGEKTIPGALVFKLYDTFGFPVDIVEDVVLERGFALDMDGFNTAMGAQKARSRTKVEFASASDAVKKLSGQGVKTRFVGYESLWVRAKILAMIKDGAEVKSADAGEDVEIITDETPFYGESGGQAGDTGRIETDSAKALVTNTIKDPTGLFVHQAKIGQGSLITGQTVSLFVDDSSRRATARNHTATHLLHAALRQVLGEHAKQAGSLVGPARLRFDFSHFEALTREQIREIETIVNSKIRENQPVCVDEMDAKTARQSGATALFEEKYGETVRVVSVSDFSKELCGGTHTDRTGDIGLLVIVSESGIAAGVRRIEALTGSAALEYLHSLQDNLARCAALVKDRPEAVPEKVERLLSQYKEQEKQLAVLKAKLAAAAAGDSEQNQREINGVKVWVQKVEADSPNALREAADRFRDKI